MRRTIVPLIAVLSIAACTITERPPENVGADQDAVQASDAHLAHNNYTDAVNSNDIDSIMGMMTEDVVFLVAHAAPMVGKAAVRGWGAGYLEAFETHWEKESLEFTVSGEWAFDRYSYKSTDTPRDGGDVVTDTGWGLVVYHRGADGKWRVARDAFGTDQPLP